MQDTYLEVTFRHGRPLAAYLHLPRRDGDSSRASRRMEGGLVVDYAEDGRPIGIEITAPTETSLESINGLLRDLGQDVITADDLAPLHAA